MTLDRDPPPPPPITLRPRSAAAPKVLNRVLAGATSMGVKRIVLVNAWRVEKSYWQSPRLSEENLLLQRVIGLEQARDTILPSIELHRLFRPFVEEVLPSLPGAALRVPPRPRSKLPLPHSRPRRRS